MGVSVLGIVGRASAGGQSTRESDALLFFNIGCGIDIQLNDRIFLNVEPKIFLDARDGIGVDFVLSAGIVYRF